MNMLRFRPKGRSSLHSTHSFLLLRPTSGLTRSASTYRRFGEATPYRGLRRFAVNPYFVGTAIAGAGVIYVTNLETVEETGRRRFMIVGETSCVSNLALKSSGQLNSVPTQG